MNVTPIQPPTYPPPPSPQHLQMLGMHGTVFANYAVDQADLLVALGVRFDDRVTGKLDAFAARARIVHIGEGGTGLRRVEHTGSQVAMEPEPVARVAAGGGQAGRRGGCYQRSLPVVGRDGRWMIGTAVRLDGSWTEWTGMDAGAIP